MKHSDVLPRQAWDKQTSGNWTQRKEGISHSHVERPDRDWLGGRVESMFSIQAHFAFNRGAARQFHLPWFIDFSVRFCPKPALANDRHLFSEHVA
jgi:hypothetical protein